MALEQDKNNEVVDQKLQETESMKKSLEDMLYTNNKNEHHNEDESDLRNQVNKFMDLVKTMDTLNSSVLLEKLAKSPEASKVLD
ncbi:TPA: hypothetical protein DEP21_04090 [Patescibacteria group bacterium]|nr:hypothetical protein [Candidatus Gracilibacteria bacterium]